MLISLRSLRGLVLALCLITGALPAFAESLDSGEEVTKEVSKYSEESAKLREEHIQELRKIHTNFVNELYDKKLAHYKEMAALWKNKAKPDDKAGLKKLRDEIKAKNKAYKEAEKKFKKDFYEDILKKKENEFRKTGKDRLKEMKKKVKK